MATDKKKRRFIPTRKQFDSWSMPNKITYIAGWLAILSLLWGFSTFFLKEENNKCKIKNFEKHEVFNFENFTESKWLGWGGAIENKNTYYLLKQPDSNYLTLYTLEGDIYVKSEYREKSNITNLLLKEINFECGEIITTIKNFRPTQNYQQAGLILIDNNFENFARQTVIYSKGIKEKKDIHQHQIQMLYGELSDPAQEHKLLRQEYEIDSLPTIENILLKIKIDENILRFFYKTSKYKAFQEIHKTEIDFIPKYLSIGAFHGISKHDSANSKLNADTITVQFQNLEIKY